MPSPIGHALGGIATGWPLVPRRNRYAALALAAVAAAPDLDLLIATHRGASHSLGAAIIAGGAAAALWAVCAPPAHRGEALRAGLAVTLAWASHILLDWLSNDTRPPLGVMALWPITHDYFKASIEIFPPVSRRYWESRFWMYNLRAVAVELVIMGPIAALVTGCLRRARQAAPRR